MGILIVRSDGTIVLDNSSAIQICAENPHLSIKNGFLLIEGKTPAAILGNPSHRKKRSDNVPKILKVESGRRHLQIALQRLKETAVSDDEVAPIAVYLLDHGTSLVDQGRLKEFYGLTQGESRLAYLLADGIKAETAAQNLNIQLSTARTVQKRIYSKLLINSQVQLVREIHGGISSRLEFDADER